TGEEGIWVRLRDVPRKRRSRRRRPSREYASEAKRLSRPSGVEGHDGRGHVHRHHKRQRKDDGRRRPDEARTSLERGELRQVARKKMSVKKPRPDLEHSPQKCKQLAFFGREVDVAVPVGSPNDSRRTTVGRFMKAA